jgi:hypothetical protein
LSVLAKELHATTRVFIINSRPIGGACCRCKVMNQSSSLIRGRHVIATLLAGSALAFCTVAMAYPGEEFAKDAKIDIQAARDIALKARPGKITDEELEKEKGGSGLRYSFDIKAGSKTYEVGVDAVTGKLLENKREGKHPD